MRGGLHQTGADVASASVLVPETKGASPFWVQGTVRRAGGPLRWMGRMPAGGCFTPALTRKVTVIKLSIQPQKN